MSQRHDCPPDCYQGSTDFYDTPATDPYTPSYLEALPLKDSVGTRYDDGSYPPWIDLRSTKSPSEQYVEWFNGIWHTGDPSAWGPSVFTSQAVMIDPTGISRGAKEAASSFVLLFEYFPDLRGEVVSWAANDREILINWRFKILPREGDPLLVTVVDKFCFDAGLVSFRLAFFDIVTFSGYLAENFGNDQLIDYLMATIRMGRREGQLRALPSLLWHFVQGMFVWQPAPPGYGLTVTPGDGYVALSWQPTAGVTSYRVTRATSLSGPFELPPSIDGNDPAKVPATHYLDTTVTNGTVYWYVIRASFGEAKPTPVLPVSMARTSTAAV